MWTACLEMINFDCKGFLADLHRNLKYFSLGNFASIEIKASSYVLKIRRFPKYLEYNTDRKYKYMK